MAGDARPQAGHPIPALHEETIGHATPPVPSRRPRPDQHPRPIDQAAGPDPGVRARLDVDLAIPSIPGRRPAAAPSREPSTRNVLCPLSVSATDVTRCTVN